MKQIFEMFSNAKIWGTRYFSSMFLLIYWGHLEWNTLYSGSADYFFLDLFIHLSDFFFSLSEFLRAPLCNNCLHSLNWRQTFDAFSECKILNFSKNLEQISYQKLISSISWLLYFPFSTMYEQFFKATVEVDSFQEILYFFFFA